ncbi:MAG TPA: PQQ-binding-like beta-propeller repeat protein [Pirellulaceae bacterium]|nr:PQQ-binding-like beta-propeller repeat protein [Pirellulaceae bacterium]
MNTSFGRIVVGTLIVVFAVTNSICVGDDWTRFLGPNGTATDSSASIPSTWNLSENMAWQVGLPGFGSSSPIVVGDRVFVTCYSGFGLDPEAPGNAADLRRHLVCLDRLSGQLLWDKPILSEHEEDPYQGFIREHGYASSTPASDGHRLFVLFGKSGLYAFDLDGNVLWHKNLGTFSDPAKWGDGCSPVLYKNLVIINVGNVGRALVALQQDNGEEAWRIDDERFGNSWSTPILVELPERTELVLNIPSQVIGIDPDSGKLLWHATSPVTQTTCASLAQHEGIVFVMGGRDGKAAAIRCGGSGDVTETHTVWTQPLRAGIGTPLVSDGLLYWHSNRVATCADCATGTEVFRERMPSIATPAPERRGPAGDYASAIRAGDKIILLSRDGYAVVIACDREFKVLGIGEFGDDPGPFNATPALDGDQMFVRSNRAIYCVSQRD